MDRPVYSLLLVAAYCVPAGLYLAFDLLHYPIPGFFARLAAVCACVVIFAAANALGKKTLAASKAGPEAGLEKNVFATGLGCGLLSILLLVIGSCGLFSAPAVSVLLAAVLVACRKELLETVIEGRSLVSGAFRYKFGILQSVFLIFLAVRLGLTAALSFAPPTYYDALVYHLSLPELYSTAHRIYTVPYNLFTFFPQNMEMLFGAGMMLGGDTAPNLLSFGMMLLSVAAIWSFCRRFLGGWAAYASVIIYFSAPAVMLLGSSAYIEQGLALYVLLAVYCWCIYAESRSSAHIALAGVFSGLAVGVKYVGAIAPTAITLVLLAGLAGRERKTALKDTAIYLLACIAAYLPWAAKNILSAGNPVFPLLHGLFGAKGMNAKLADGYFSMLASDYSHKNILSELVNFPLDIVRAPAKFAGGFDILGHFGWATVLLLLPLLLFALPVARPVRRLLVFAALYFCAWFAAAPVMRFLYPALAAAAIACGYALSEVWDRKTFILKYAAPAATALMFISNNIIILTVLDSVKPFNAALGLETKEHYLSTRLANSPYRAFEFINQNLPPDSRILFAGEQRGFYCKRDYVSSQYSRTFSVDPLVEWAGAAKDGGGLREKLVSEGFTHVLYNRAEGARLKGYGIMDFSPEGEKNWQGLLVKMQPLFSDGNVTVCALK